MQVDQEQITDDPEATSAESQSSAETDLASLMDEWNKSEEQKPAPQARKEEPRQAPPVDRTGPDIGKLLEGMKPVISYTEKKMAQERREEEDKVIKEAVTSLKGEELTDIDDSLAEGFLFRTYQRNASFQKAYDNRMTDPSSWNNALSEARTEFQTKVKPLLEKSSEIRSDLEAASAAVNGQSETVEESEGYTNEQLMEMSDSEFKAFKMKLDPG